VTRELVSCLSPFVARRSSLVTHSIDRPAFAQPPPFCRCFRSLLLVACPYLYLTKALVPDLDPTRIGYAKLGGNILQSNKFT